MRALAPGHHLHYCAPERRLTHVGGEERREARASPGRARRGEDRLLDTTRRVEEQFVEHRSEGSDGSCQKVLRFTFHVFFSGLNVG